LRQLITNIVMRRETAYSTKLRFGDKSMKVVLADLWRIGRTDIIAPILDEPN
jgi:hypothetical protein